VSFKGETKRVLRAERGETDRILRELGRGLVWKVDLPANRFMSFYIMEGETGLLMPATYEFRESERSRDLYGGGMRER